jgi:hypothetical protein
MDGQRQHRGCSGIGEQGCRYGRSHGLIFDCSFGSGTIHGRRARGSDQRGEDRVGDHDLFRTTLRARTDRDSPAQVWKTYGHVMPNGEDRTRSAIDDAMAPAPSVEAVTGK